VHSQLSFVGLFFPPSFNRALLISVAPLSRQLSSFSLTTTRCPLSLVFRPFSRAPIATRPNRLCPLSPLYRPRPPVSPSLFIARCRVFFCFFFLFFFFPLLPPQGSDFPHHHHPLRPWVNFECFDFGLVMMSTFFFQGPPSSVVTLEPFPFFPLNSFKVKFFVSS